MNKRQRIKRRRLGITKLVMKLLKEIDEIQESKSERRIRPLMHKRWVHKRFYVRRKLSKTEQLVIEFLMRAAHRRFSPAAFYNRTICLEQFVLFGMQQGKSYINSVNRYLRYNEFFSSIVKQIYDTSVASCDCGLFRGNCFIGQKCLHCKTEVIAR